MQRPIALPGGSESTVHRIPSPGGDLILKKPATGGRQQYRFEAFACQQMERQGAKVPHILFADDDILLMTALPGQDIDGREDLIGNTPFFDAAAADLARCHALMLPGFGVATETPDGAFSGKSPNWQTYLGGALATLTTLRPIGDLTSADLRALQSFWEQTVPAISLVQGTLVHGDFAPPAIFAKGQTYAGIIDFGDALIGDPLMDLAYFRFKEITKPYGAAAYHQLRNAYISARTLRWDDAHEKRTLFYMVYWGVERLARCPDAKLRAAFAGKLHATAQLLA